MSYINQASVGFSGVIFALALIDSYRSTQPTRSVFGFVQVPTRMYPWVLLVLLSVRPPSRERWSAVACLRCSLCPRKLDKREIVFPEMLLCFSSMIPTVGLKHREDDRGVPYMRGSIRNSHAAHAQCRGEGRNRDACRRRFGALLVPPSTSCSKRRGGYDCANAACQQANAILSYSKRDPR